MVASYENKEQIFIGIDGGGTKCRATLFSDENGVLGTGLGGPANPLHGLERAIESIMVSTQNALNDAGLNAQKLNSIIAGLGLAGVNIPDLYQQITQWQHPFKNMFLTTDLHTACIGAHDGKEGAVIITGTGSCGFVCANGKSTIFGGHGFVQGDIGSGAWFGLEAVKAALLSIDQLGPKTQLAEVLLEYFDVTDAMGIAQLMAGKPSSSYAQLSPLVIETAKANDAVALALVKNGARYISDLAYKLLEKNPARLSIIGGLSEPLQLWLDKEVVEFLKPAIHPPEIGAIYFAQNSIEA